MMKHVEVLNFHTEDKEETMTERITNLLNDCSSAGSELVDIKISSFDENGNAKMFFIMIDSLEGSSVYENAVIENLEKIAANVQNVAEMVDLK